tara:strand:- start:126 stop:839 length:714 start_codon:yes stop_codon:yes gene_type:complete
MASDNIENRLQAIKTRMSNAARRVGRNPGDISLLAASKTVDRQVVLDAISSGLDHIGENQIQEAETKFGDKAESLADTSVNFHMIGHLQTNKVRKALELFDTIQSLDSVKLAQRINSIATEMHKTVSVYVEVSLASEDSKTGIDLGGLNELVSFVRESSNLRLEGLMTVPPFLEDPEDVRPYFRKLREIRDELHDIGLINEDSLKLSMGMSHDFEVAIEEGATMVRLGRIVWGGFPA